MKYTILGFSQQKLIDSRMDLKDAAILRYILDFAATEKMKTIIHEKKEYFWIFYESILEEIPIIEINNKRSVARRLKKMVDIGFLEQYIQRNEGGTFSFYRTTEKIVKLLGGRTEISRGVGLKGIGGVDSKVQSKIPLLDHSSSKLLLSEDNMSRRDKIPSNPNSKVLTGNIPCKSNFRIDPTILSIIKTKILPFFLFKNIFPENTESSATKKYMNIQEFIYRFRELKLDIDYKWDKKWINKSNIDWKYIRNMADGRMIKTIPMENVEKLIIRAVRRYARMFKQGYWPYEKKWLSMDLYTFFYNFKTQKSWFLFCLFNKPVEIKEKVLDISIENLPEEIREYVDKDNPPPGMTIQDFVNGLRSIYDWYVENKQDLEKYHVINHGGNFSAKIHNFDCLVDYLMEFRIEIWEKQWGKGSWNAKNFLYGSKTWQCFVNWMKNERDFDLNPQNINNALELYNLRYKN